VKNSTNNVAPEDSELLEIAALTESGGQRVSVVLTRRDISDALKTAHSVAATNGWAGIEVNREAVIATWLKGRFGNRHQAEEYLANCTLHKPYLLAELGMKDQQDLLVKFFENKSGDSNAWWIEKGTKEWSKFREADIVATLKANGFEVLRGDIAPVLFVRRK
jgi:hypothetical protein